MKKKCSHCFHKILNTERTIIRIDSCERIGETIFQPGGFVYVKVDEECCHCNQKITITITDYDCVRAGKYPTEKEYILKEK